MLADFVGKIAQLANAKTIEPKYIPMPGQPGCYQLINSDGSVGDVVGPEFVRRETLRNIASIVVAYADYDSPMLYVNSRQLKVVDRSDARDASVLNLTRSSISTEIEEYDGTFKIPSLINWIRRREDYIDNSQELLLVLRNMNWELNVVGNRESTGGKSNYGESVKAEIGSQHGELPETIRFRFPLLAPGQLQEEALCFAELILEPDPEAKMFSILSPVGLPEQFQAEIIAQVGYELGQTDVEWYVGTAPENSHAY